MKDLSLALVIPAVAVKTQFLTYIAPAVASVPDILRTAGAFFLDLLRKSSVVFLTGKHRHLTFTENRHHSGIDVFHSRNAYDKKGILAVTGCIVTHGDKFPRVGKQIVGKLFRRADSFRINVLIIINFQY